MEENFTNILYSTLIFKYLDDTADEYEVREVEEWLKDKNNVIAFEKIKQIWNLESDNNEIATYDSTKVYPTIQKRIQKQKIKSTSYISFVLKIAAILILFVGVYYYVYEKPDTQIISSNIEQTSLGILPDGSSFFLNSGSQIEYKDNFATKRNLTLSGEAYFDVVRDKKSPFVVKTPHGSVQVLGTSFDVKAYPNDSIFKVIVLEGKVQVSMFDDSNKKIVENTLLEKDQIVIFDIAAGKITKKEINYTDLNDISWKTHSLFFENSSFEYVISTLEKYYNIRITVNSKNLYNSRLTTSFNHLSFEDAIKIVAFTLKFDYHIQGKNVNID